MQAIKIVGQVLIVAAFLDVLILTASMAQIATEGRTGYWSPFWRVQAEFVLSPFK